MSRLLPGPALLALALLLSGCGGAGGPTTFVNNPPPPPEPVPAPTPTPPSDSASSPDMQEAIALLDHPATQTFVTTGWALMGLPLISYDAESDLYRISYNDGTDWEAIWDGPGYRDPATGTQTHYSGMTQLTSPTATDPEHRYLYSVLLQGWAQGPYDDWEEYQHYYERGYAVGSPTSPDAIPTSGTAHYTGLIAGTSEAYHSGPFSDVDANIAGTIDLRFDFGAANLSGHLDPQISNGIEWIDLPSLALVDTLVSGTGYSGRFQTSLSGENSFAGLFTGPNAEETIGSFAFPFVIPEGYYFIGSTTGGNPIAHGAFVAKR